MILCCKWIFIDQSLLVPSQFRSAHFVVDKQSHNFTPCYQALHGGTVSLQYTSVMIKHTTGQQLTQKALWSTGKQDLVKPIYAGSNVGPPTFVNFCLFCKLLLFCKHSVNNTHALLLIRSSTHPIHLPTQFTRATTTAAGKYTCSRKVRNASVKKKGFQNGRCKTIGVNNCTT